MTVRAAPFVPVKVTGALRKPVPSAVVTRSPNVTPAAVGARLIGIQNPAFSAITSRRFGLLMPLSVC